MSECLALFCFFAFLHFCRPHVLLYVAACTRPIIDGDDFRGWVTYMLILLSFFCCVRVLSLFQLCWIDPAGECFFFWVDREMGRAPLKVVRKLSVALLLYALQALSLEQQVTAFVGAFVCE